MAEAMECPAFAGLFWFAVGALVFGFYFVMLRNMRQAENLPTSTCRAVPMGLVEVAGTAAGVPFASPFGRIPSLCSSVIVEEWREGTRTDYWREIYRADFSTPFHVEDPTGRVRVMPDEAELNLDLDYSFDMVSGLQAGAVARARLRDAGLDEEGIRQRLLQFAEGRARDHVDAGTLACEHREPELRGDLTAQVFARGLGIARMIQRAPRDLQFRRPKVPRGTRAMRMREDNLCPGDPVYVLGTATAQDDSSTGQEGIIIGRGSLHPWFVIGETSQKDTLARMSRHAWLVALTGALLMLMGVAMLLDCVTAS